MKVLVTGAAGFLGSHVVEDLVGLGYDVVATSRDEAKFRKQSPVHARLTFIPVDLSDHTQLTRLPHDITHIVHCAAHTTPWGAYATFVKHNVSSVRHLIDYAKTLPNFVRFVHVSTPSLYFGYESRTDVTEDERRDGGFLNNYTLTKYEAECVLDEQFRTEQFPFVGIRPRALYGERDTTVLARLIQANETIGVPLVRNGEHRLDMTYVKNVSHSIHCALQAADAVLGHYFNVTNDDPRTFRNVMDMLFQQLNIPFRARRVHPVVLYGAGNALEMIYRTFRLHSEPRITRYTASVLTHTQTLNVDKAKTMLGYKPIYSTEEGVVRYANWYTDRM
ncbi:MAG: NAD-dependent epimerase/dehydratase family protein [Bacilli bacterium]